LQANPFKWLAEHLTLLKAVGRAPGVES